MRWFPIVMAFAAVACIDEAADDCNGCEPLDEWAICNDAQNEIYGVPCADTGEQPDEIWWATDYCQIAIDCGPVGLAYALCVFEAYAVGICEDWETELVLVPSEAAEGECHSAYWKFLTDCRTVGWNTN